MEALRDFPTALSPMLVKELRQGMRTNMFTIAFILLQTFMVLCLLAGIGSPGCGGADAFFWFFIVSTLLVVQPLRGFSALSSEYQLNTMDLIQLTRLDAWRITLGKWTALNAQSLLLITGVLPYLVMRYFLGNVNFVVDLLGLALISVGSGLTTAITIGCSVFKNFLLRGVLVIVFGIGTTILFVGAMEVLDNRSIAKDELLALGSAAVAGVYGIFFFLSFGASRISPLSENLATRKRLAAILAVLVTYSLYLFDAPEAILAVSSVILALGVVDAITEPLPIFARVLQPFKKNFLLRLSALFLCPGWIGGLGFFFLAIFLWLGAFGLAILSGENLLDRTRDWVAFFSGCNVLVFPLIIIHLFFRKLSQREFTFALYIFIQACLFVVTLMVSAMAEAMSHYEEVIFASIPIPSVLLFASAEGETDGLYFLLVSVCTTFLCIIIPRLRNRSHVKEFLRELFSSE